MGVLHSFPRPVSLGQVKRRLEQPDASRGFILVRGSLDVGFFFSPPAAFFPCFFLLPRKLSGCNAPYCHQNSTVLLIYNSYQHAPEYNDHFGLILMYKRVLVFSDMVAYAKIEVAFFRRNISD